MPYDSDATRARLLDAAYAEFSERGLSGARVDRIAAAASANKQAIYAYFGSKNDLFDAMIANRLGILADTVPFTPDDLPGYAGALFDAFVANPELVRLTHWKWLEHTEPSAAELGSYRAKADALRSVMGLTESTAIDVLLIVMAICGTWFTTAPAIQALGGRGTTKRRAAHRAVVVASVTALVATLDAEHAGNEPD
jgi:AcrR family transcriptional regulator